MAYVLQAAGDQAAPPPRKDLKVVLSESSKATSAWCRDGSYLQTFTTHTHTQRERERDRRYIRKSLVVTWHEKQHKRNHRWWQVAKETYTAERMFEASPVLKFAGAQLP